MKIRLNEDAEIVKTVKEILLVGYIITDCLFDADCFFKVINLFDKSLEFFLIRFALNAEIIGNLCITLKCVRMVVLREGAHLCGSLGGVEAENLINHQSVCNSVWQVVESTELMSH